MAAPRPRVVVALAALLALAGCTNGEALDAAVVTVQQTPSATRVIPPAPAEPTPTAEPVDTSALLIAEVEDQVFALANEARAAEGLAPLERMADLDVVARGWSATLAAEGRELDHNPDYSRQIPQGWSTAGENVAWMGETRVLPAAEIAGPVHQGWMDSPGHRENLLGAEYTHLGVGVAFSPEHGYYLTQNFATY